MSCGTSYVPSSYSPICTHVPLIFVHRCLVDIFCIGPLMQLHASLSQAFWPTHAFAHLCISTWMLWSINLCSCMLTCTLTHLCICILFHLHISASTTYPAPHSHICMLVLLICTCVPLNICCIGPICSCMLYLLKHYGPLMHLCTCVSSTCVFWPINLCSCMLTWDLTHLCICIPLPLHTPVPAT